MAISLRACGSWAASNATTQTVTLPTHAAGDLLIVRAACKPYNATITCSTEGWLPVGNQYQNGTTANGNGLGSLAFRAFYKIAASASEASPVIAWGTTSAPGVAVALSYQCGATEGWLAPVGAGGGDSTARTAHTATISSHISTTAGDMVDFFTAWCDNYAATVPTFTQAGLTLGTVSEQPDTAGSFADSNDAAADGGYRLVSSGTSSAAAVVTGTFGNSEQGGSWTTRLRVAADQTLTVPLLDESGNHAVYAPTIQEIFRLTVPLIDAGRAIYAPTVIPELLISLPLIDFTVAPGSEPPAYADVVMADSPVAYWRLGEPSGTTLDDATASANDMTLASGTLGYAGLLTGDSDTCLDLNGSSNCASRAIDASLNVGDNFTIEAWINADVWVNSGVIYNHGVGTGSPSLELSTGGFVFLWVGGTPVASNTVGDLTTGTIYHIVATKNGSTRAIYINGVDVTSPGSNATANNSQTGVRSIGSYDAGGQYFNGRIDEVAIYGTALTKAQVAEHYAVGLALISKGWEWFSDEEGFTSFDGLGLTQWVGSGGKPGGYLQITADSFDYGDSAYVAFDQSTWEEMGVPVGATVTRARLRSVWRQVAGSGNSWAGGGVLLFDTGQNYLGTLLNYVFVGIAAWTQAGEGSWVNFADQASDSAVRICLGTNAAYEGGDSWSVSSFDSLYIEIEYTAGDAGAGGRVVYAPTLEQLAPSGPQDLVVPLIDAGAAIYAPSVLATQALTVPLIDAGAALYAPTLTPINLLTVPLIDAGAAIYAPTVIPDLLLTVPLVETTPAIYAPTLTGINLLTVPLVESTPAVYAPSVYPAQFLTVPLVETTPDLYAPTLLLAPYPITLPLIDAGADLFAPTVTKVGALPQDILLVLIDAGAEVYAPTVVPDQLLTVPLIDAGADLFAPTVLPQPVTVTLVLIDSGAEIYTPSVGLAIALPLIDAGSAIYAPVLTPVNTLVVGLIDAGNAIYVVTLTGKNLLTVPLVGDDPAIYAPSLLLAPYLIAVPLIDGGADLYAPSITALGTIQTIILTLLDGEAAVYAPSVLAEQDLVVPLIDGGATLYVPSLLPFNLLTIPAIDAGADIFAPTLTTRYVIVLPLIDAVADLYAPTVLPGPVTVVVPLVGDDPVLYAPTVVQEATKLIVPLIDGEGAIYALTITLASVTLSGYTRTCNGAILPFATIDVFRSVDNVWITTVVSDALGHYSAIVAPGVEHYLVAFHASNVYGVTARDLVGA